MLQQIQVSQHFISFGILAIGLLFTPISQAEVRQPSTFNASISSSLPQAILNQLLDDAKQQWRFNGRVTQVVPYDPKEGLLWVFTSDAAPKWRVTLENSEQRLIYLTSDTGKFRNLVKRENPTLSKEIPTAAIAAVQKAALHHWSFPGATLNLSQPEHILIKQARVLGNHQWQFVVEGRADQVLTYQTDAAGQSIRAFLPDSFAQTAIATAKGWNLPNQGARIVDAQQTTWGFGCDQPRTLPIGCDPAIATGWLVYLESEGQRWTVRIDNAGSYAEVIARHNLKLDSSFSQAIEAQVRTLAASHLELKPAQILITQVQRQDWQDSCLGLRNPNERCQPIRGSSFRAIVEGKPGQQQIYRVSTGGADLIRTEAIGNLPPRIDALPNPVFQKVMQDAQVRFKRPMRTLRMTKPEATIGCQRTPTSPPNDCPFKVQNGWQLQVTNLQRSLTYQIDLSGGIRSARLK